MSSKRWAAVCRLGGIGDDLIAASVCPGLQKQGYNVEFIAAEPQHVVLHHNPHIDKLSIKRPGDLPEDQSVWQLWMESRSREVDVFAHLSHSCEMRHAVWPNMTSFWWPQDYRRKIFGGSYLETVCDIANVPYESLGDPLFYSSESEKDRALSVKSKVGPKMVGWVVSGSRVDKTYPAATLAVSRIIKQLGIPVVVFGSLTPREHEMAKTIIDVVQRQNSSLEGIHSAITEDNTEPGGDRNWPIRRSLAMLQQCDVVIGPDTGAMWGVAMDPMPKILLHSHASVENITKHWKKTISLHADKDRVPCSPCHRLHNDLTTCVANADGNGAACISDISVECLITAVRAALGDAPSMRQLTSQWESNVTLRGEWGSPVRVLAA